MNRKLLTLFFAFGLSGAMQIASAQSANVYFGLGTATASSSNQQIDPFGTGIPYTTPKMAGLFPDLGASLMVTQHVGLGADVSWRASKGAYTGFLYRPIFYTFDGIYQPVNKKHFAPELRAGIGGMSLRYSYSQQSCNPLTGCSTEDQSVASGNHFQFHYGAAVRFNVTDHIFLRPAFDGHYVQNLFQFGSNWVPQYSLGIGYSFGAGG
jgi:hypothetical protein